MVSEIPSPLRGGTLRQPPPLDISSCSCGQRDLAERPPVNEVPSPLWRSTHGQAPPVDDPKRLCQPLKLRTARTYGEYGDCRPQGPLLLASMMTMMATLPSTSHETAGDLWDSERTECYSQRDRLPSAQQVSAQLDSGGICLHA